MKKLLLADDEEPLVQLLGEYLRRAGYDVVTALDGGVALHAAEVEAPDLVVLDVRMPGLDGWQTLERLRAASRVPVIMLTALGDEPHVLRGFSLGADDYVCKPFSFAQLEARIRTVLRRSGGGGEEVRGVDADILRAGDLAVDLAACRVWRAGELVQLTPTEFKLLLVLMRHAGRVLSSRQIVIDVWGQEYADDASYVRRYIWHLRRKLEPHPDQPRYIHNERSFGYRFDASGDGQASPTEPAASA